MHIVRRPSRGVRCLLAGLGLAALAAACTPQPAPPPPTNAALGASVVPAFLDEATLGNGHEQDVTITNTGNAATGVLDAEITIQSGTVEFAIDDAGNASKCDGSTVAAAQDCSVHVVFESNGAVTSYTATLTVSDSLGHSVDVPLSGAVRPDISANPSPVELRSSVNLDDSETISIQNVADQATGNLDVTLINAGNSTGSFSPLVTDCNVGPLAPGAICSATVEFGAFGPLASETAQVKIEATPGGTVIVNVNALGIEEPVPTFSPDPVVITDDLAESGPGTLTLTINNPSPIAMDGLQFGELSDPFSTFSDAGTGTCVLGATVPGNGSCTVDLVFAAQNGFGAVGSFQSSTSAPGSTASVVLQGNVVDSGTTLSSADAFVQDSPTGGGTAVSLRLTNTGGNTSAPLFRTLNGITGAGVWIVSNDTCHGAVLAPGDFCDVEVTYTNDAGDGSSGTISVVVLGDGVGRREVTATGVGNP